MPRPARPSVPASPVDRLDNPPAPACQDSAAEDAKRAFLRTVSHELRTPLNAIIGFSEILAAELYGPLGARQYREYAEHVRQSGYRLLKLVNQVLEIARLQGDAIDLSAEIQPLDHVLDDVLDQLREDHRASGVRVVVENEGRLPSVRADAKGVRTLLFNLLQNAMLHGAGGGLVEVRAGRREARIEIEVRDHGAGVDPADIPRLLAPFEQGDGALTRTGRGAGLGLPIARLLAAAMGGQLQVSSRPGEGLLAKVTLPAA